MSELSAEMLGITDVLEPGEITDALYALSRGRALQWIEDLNTTAVSKDVRSATIVGEKHEWFRSFNIYFCTMGIQLQPVEVQVRKIKDDAAGNTRVYARSKPIRTTVMLSSCMTTEKLRKICDKANGQERLIERLVYTTGKSIKRYASGVLVIILSILFLLSWKRTSGTWRI